MGKGRDKRKKHEDAEKVQKRAERQRAKLSRNEGKGEGAAPAEGLNGEENIVEMAARLQRAENKRKGVQEVDLAQAPSPRANCVFVPYPNRDGEFVIFGGEFWDGANTQAYNDLLVYNVFKNKWRQIQAPCTPCPRSSCQGWTHKQHLYIHGGEIVSRSQSQFMHFRDLWRVDLQSCVWEELTKGKGGPSARSGHRVAPYKRGGAALFGGFFDNGQHTIYYDDLWVLTEVDAGGVWTEILQPQFAEKPHPRSGHSLASHGDEIFLFGGYYTFRANRFQRAEATVLHDLWTINLASETPLWQKLRLGGIPPPIRSGMGFCQKDKKLFLFGGVVDLDGPGGKTVSTFHNDLFVFNMETKKFFPVLLSKRSNKSKKKTSIDSDEKSAAPSNKTKSLADEINQAVGKTILGDSKKKAVASKNDGRDDETTSSDDDGDSDDSSSSDSSTSDSSSSSSSSADNNEAGAAKKDSKGANDTGKKPEKPVELSAITLKDGRVVPCPRMNAMMCAHSHFLILYGGVFEIGKREIALSDLYTLNLNILDTYTAHQVTDVRTIPWNGEAAGDSGSDAGSWEEGSTVAPEMLDALMDDLDDEDDDGDSHREGQTTTTNIDNNRNNNNNDDDDDDDEGAKAPSLLTAKLLLQQQVAGAGESRTNIRGKIGKGHHLEQLKQQLSGTSIVPTPMSEETLQQFFARTEMFWMNSAAEELFDMKDASTANRNQRKRITKSAEELSRIRFLEARDLIRQIEDIERQLLAEKEVLREHLRQKQAYEEAELKRLQDEEDEDEDNEQSSSSDDDESDKKKGAKSK